MAHTRPRCEKKLKQYCDREGVAATLPLVPSTHRYRGKVVVFQKPLFPGYVFLRPNHDQRRLLRCNDYVANLLEVYDQKLFEQQLTEILFALDSGCEVQLAPRIGKGTRVMIKSGPLRGLEGWVEERYGPNVVLLRLDFIGQAAAVKLDVCELEPL
ncbi:MAG: transcription termination/antitermination NusG family protein [Verrucomicrobiota bacterium]|nr:hypothetical protein [Limisphaera sp.]MDW8382762.1 transcription termination/antitermination NusG family protein [Verrucomicrobiota bacterium]